MKRLLIHAAAILSATAAVCAQNARDQTLLPTNNVQAFDNVIATDGDLSAIAYSVNGGLEVRTSSGAGITWGAGVRVDQGPGAASRVDITRTGLQIVQGVIYVLWRDRRTASDELYISASHDSGATWSPELLVFTFPIGNNLRDWRMAISGGGVMGVGTVAVLALNDPDGMSSEELSARVSFDGATTFLASSVVPQGYLPGAQDVDDIDVSVADDQVTVNVAFSDDRAGGAAGFPDDVFFQQSIDGGQTWLATDRQITTVLGANQGGLLDMAQAGNKIAVTWNQNSGANDEVRLAVSNDGGATFAPDVLVGSAPTIGETQGPQLGITDNNSIIVAYLDGPSFNGIATTLTTTDDGATFTAPSTYGVPSTVDTASFPTLAVQGEGAVLAWSTAQSGGMSDRAFCVVTNDHGQTWSGAIQCSAPIGADVDFVTGAYNGLYDNGLVCFLRDPRELFIGGVRPQTVDAIGWDDITNPASTTLGFDTSNFPTDTLVFVVLSLGTGPTPIGAERSIDLNVDFINLFAEPLFTAFLVGGSGSTPVVPNIFQPFPSAGVTLHYAGIGFSAAGPGKITDSQSFVF